MKCLDVGCGGGHVALLMARIVGPDGRVIGTDTDGETLALARNDAEAANMANVEFQQVDACASFWQEEFDIAYARFLLSHLQTPANCLATMVTACRPEGTIVIEDTDFSGSFCYPHCAAYERYNELYQEVVQRRGGDPNIRTETASAVAQSRYPRRSIQCDPTRSHPGGRQIDGADHHDANIRRTDWRRTRQQR